MKHEQIQPLYLEPRLHKQSVKQETHNHVTCLAKPLHTKQQQNVWQTIGSPSVRLLSDLPKICPLRSDGPTSFKNSAFDSRSLMIMQIVTFFVILEFALIRQFTVSE